MTEQTLEFDIVIVGSGAGGGTVAKELSRYYGKNAKIALLEWGGKFEAHDNLRKEVEMANRYYVDGGGFQTESQDMTLAFAKAVGGSTTVYTGTSLKAPESVFNKWNIPGIDLNDLNPRYEKYILENNVHLLAGNEINDNNKLFVKGCQSLGWSVSQFPVNVKGCKGLGTCNLGCARLAKQGTNVVQIPEAEKNGVTVFPFCRVEKIKENAVFVTVLPPEYNLTACTLRPGQYVFRTKKIVLSGGAMGTPPLLIKSFGLGFNPVLGRYFTVHPAMMLVAEHPAPIQNIQGHPKSFYCDQFSESERFLLETCMYFPFTTAKSLCGFGEEPHSFLSHFDRLQMILALAHDPALSQNQVTVDSNGNTRVYYHISKEIVKVLTQAIRASAKIFFAAGAKRVHAPASGRFFLAQKDIQQIDTLVQEKLFKLGQVSISAAHLMGGARMGVDPKTSVTDPWGRVHGKKDIYVADASLFPMASEVNPYLTIMALADRVAQAIYQDH